MPFGRWKNWNTCIGDMEHKYSPESAKKVCGSLQAKLEKAVKVLGRSNIPNRPHSDLQFGAYNYSQERNMKSARERARQDQYPHNEDRAALAEGRPGLVKAECPCKKLIEGQKVESEHERTLESAGVPKDKVKLAEAKIAADHLKEDPDYYPKLKQMEKAMTAGGSATTGSGLMHTAFDSGPEPNIKKIKKADTEQVETDEKEIKNLHLKSKLSPGLPDLKEMGATINKEDVKKEWMLNLQEMLESDREFTGTFHKPVIDKENDIIPARAMDGAMDDFMTLPTLQEVHTERPVGIIIRAWKTNEDEYKFIGKIKPGADCDDVWKKVQDGIYDGLSIGGRRIKYSNQCSIPSSIRTTPCVTQKLKLYNVSVCSSPVNPEAKVDSVSKSEDELVFDLTETLITTESADSKVIQKGDEMAEEEQIEGVSKSDEDLITKSDIAGLTKAVEELNKSFTHYFDNLTTPHPQSIGGKGHSVENTMQKGEDADENEMNFSKALDEIADLRKSFNEVISERDGAIIELQEKISKMENEKITKGGSAVIIPEQAGPEVMTNMGILASLGRTAK